MQRAKATMPGGLSLRIGLDGGEPLGDSEGLYGATLIVASPLNGRGKPGAVMGRRKRQ